VAILGDSFAIGWGISDEETFAWKLQQLLPDLRVTNHATAGYGTCQSLQMLREIVAREPPPDLILYGFYDDHLRRNVVDYPSLYTLERRSRRTSRYCQIDARGRLVEHPPELRGDWPLIKSLATVYFLQQRYELYRRSRRMKQVWPVMEAIVAEMDRVARARGSRLVFASLLCRPRPFRRMAKILEARGIPFLDCNRFLRPEWIVQGEGHPNGLMHTEWAQCLVRALPALLERR
jgi:hypothetical protein